MNLSLSKLQTKKPNVNVFDLNNSRQLYFFSIDNLKENLKPLVFRHLESESGEIPILKVSFGKIRLPRPLSKFVLRKKQVKKLKSKTSLKQMFFVWQIDGRKEVGNYGGIWDWRSK